MSLDNRTGFEILAHLEAEAGMVGGALIYDIGANNGDDTAFYLRQGYRVVAVEASIKMAAALRDRFANEIDRGTLVLLNLGIADRHGQMEFWICDDNSHWSSFDRNVASKYRSRHHSEIVAVTPFSEVLSRYGTPHYCKIDIEGNDRLCLLAFKGQSCPKYISLEMSHRDGEVDLALLRGLGYKKFKIVNQWTRTQPLYLLSGASVLLSARTREFLAQTDTRWRGVSSTDGWQFPLGSSGPFGEDTPGPWRSYAAALWMWRWLHRIDRHPKGQDLVDWYDIHATR